MPRIHNIIVAVIVSIVTTACVTFSQMEDGLKSLQGQNEQMAFAVLGYPSYKNEVAGDTVYTWRVDKAGSVYVPTVSTTSGTIGRIPFQSSTYGTRNIPIQYNCTINIATTKSGTIKSWSYDGNLGGCANFIRQLNAFNDPTQLRQREDATKKVHQAATNDLEACVFDDICEAADAKAFYAKTPCTTDETRFDQLVDNSKITPAQKEALAKANDHLNKYLKCKSVAYKKHYGSTGEAIAGIIDRANAERQKNYIDLYNEKITWGEFNRIRQAINTDMNDKLKQWSK